MAWLQARGQGPRAESSHAAARSLCEAGAGVGKVSEGSISFDVRQGLSWVRLCLLRAPLPGTRAPCGLALDCQVSCSSSPRQRQPRLCFPCSSLVLGYWSPFWSFFPGVLEIDPLTAALQLSGQRVGEEEHRPSPWLDLRG